jgi:Fic family protein
MNSLEKAYSQWLDLQPLSKKMKDRLFQRFTIDFNYNSNHIEGNTLTYGQTEALLIFGKSIGEAHMKDLEEMKASKIAQDMMIEEALIKDKQLTQNFIRIIHKTLLREDYQKYIKLDSGELSSFTIHAGQYKTRPNSVYTKSGDIFEYASPEETPALMTDLINWYNEEEAKGEMTPVDLAALFHYRFIRIHPFEDGNGRMARLLVNYILFRHNYPMVVVRSRKKDEYLDALGASDKIVGSVPTDGANATLREIRHFFVFFTNLVTEEILNDIKFVTVHDENIWWYNGEIVKFRSETSSKILTAIMMNPSITNQQISENLGISIATVNKQLNSFKENHFIMKKTDGNWQVIIYPSL